MSLVNCSECGKEISDQAPNCPHCGMLLPSENIKNEVEKLRVGVEYAKTRWVAGCFFFGGIFWLFMSAYIEGKDGFVRAWSASKWAIGFGLALYIGAEICRNLDIRKNKKNSKAKIHP